MKVGYALCGLALVLQATQIKARGVRGDPVALESYIEPAVSESHELPLESEPLTSASFVAPAESEPLATSDEGGVQYAYDPVEIPTVEEDPVYGDHTYDSTPLEGNLPTSGTDDMLYGYDEAPQEKWTIEALLPVEDDIPPVQSWEDDHPPGWNDDGLPPQYRGGYTGDDDYSGPVSVEIPPMEEDEPPNVQPMLSDDDKAPGGWGSIDPDLLGGYYGQGPSEEPTVEVLTIEEQPPVLDYVRSWEDEHPPGWNEGGINPDLLDEYSGEIDYPPPVIETIEAPPVDDYQPTWDDLHPPGWNDEGLPPQYIDGYPGYDGPDSPYTVEEPPMIYDAPDWAPQEEPIPFMTGEGLSGIPPWLLHPDYEFKPSTAGIPPEWALDADRDYEITPAEWDEYLQKVKAKATDTNARARDLHAKALLDDIIAFHYANLHDCISKRIEPSILQHDVWKFADEINKSCYIKFRYSLFAGAAPFEWVAHKQPEISADDISKWFATKFQIAKSDVAAGRIREESLQAIPMIEKSVSCLDNVLRSYRGLVRLLLEHLRRVLGQLRQRAAREETRSRCVAGAGAWDPVTSAYPASQEEHDDEEVANGPERPNGPDRGLDPHHRDRRLAATTHCQGDKHHCAQVECGEGDRNGFGELVDRARRVRTTCAREDHGGEKVQWRAAAFEELGLPRASALAVAWGRVASTRVRVLVLV